MTGRIMLILTENENELGKLRTLKRLCFAGSARLEEDSCQSVDQCLLKRPINLLPALELKTSLPQMDGWNVGKSERTSSSSSCMVRSRTQMILVQSAGLWTFFP